MKPFGVDGNMNGMAAASLVLAAAAILSSLVGMATGWAAPWILAVPCSLGALFTGYAGKSQIRQSGGAQVGLEAAIVGIVIGWLVVSVFILLLMFFAIVTLGA